MVTKSRPRNTPLTPSILNNCRARGDPRAEIGEGKSSVPAKQYRNYHEYAVWLFGLLVANRLT